MDSFFLRQNGIPNYNCNAEVKINKQINNNTHTHTHTHTNKQQPEVKSNTKTSNYSHLFNGQKQTFIFALLWCCGRLIMHRSLDRDFRQSENTYRRNKNRAGINSEAFACPEKHTYVHTNAGQG